MDDRSPGSSTETIPGPHELRAKRRAARVAANRADIMDAAERAFAEHGLDGSLRAIAELSGFSTAAIYNYFENKQQLFAETLSRRGIELLQVIAQSAATAGGPMAKLHAIADGAVDFFGTYPDFRRMLRHVREVESTIPDIIRQQAGGRIEEFTRSATLMTGIIEDGQASGEIRDGPPSALLHFYMILVYEHVLLDASDNPVAAFSREQFHDLLDGAIRRPLPRRDGLDRA